MAADPVTIQNGITIAGILVIAGFIAMLENRIEKGVSAFLNSKARRDEERAAIAEATKHLAERDRCEETRRWVKEMRASCPNCRPLSSTDAIRRDGA